jgi:hypothetical protein
MSQEVHYFHDLSLGTLVASDVREARVWPVLVVDLGLRLAEGHDPAHPPELLAATAAKPEEEPDDEEKRQDPLK